MTKQDIFYHNLRRLMKIKSVSQKELAVVIGCNDTTMSRRFERKSNFSFDDICKILSYFNISYETMTKETF